MIRMIKVDLADGQIKEVFCDASKTLETMQEAVGGYIERAIQINENNDLFVNEEGLFLFENFFSIEGGHQPFAGNGIIAGTNSDGETCSTTLTLDQVKNMIQWC